MGRQRDSRDVREAAAVACEALILGPGPDQNTEAGRYILTRVLNELVWCYTGNHADPDKYRGCPWWTESAFALQAGDRNWRRGVALDHVVERRELVGALLACKSGNEVRAVLARGETCVVLRDEHATLPKGGGWARYAGLSLVPGPRIRRRLGTNWPTPPNAP